MFKVIRNFKREMGLIVGRKKPIFFKRIFLKLLVMKRVNRKNMFLAVVCDVNVSFCEFPYLVLWLMDPN